MIDYDRMNKTFPKHKAALTRAVNSGNSERIIRTVHATFAEWDDIGAYPDSWHRWQVALEDAERAYYNG